MCFLCKCSDFLRNFFKNLKIMNNFGSEFFTFPIPQPLVFLLLFLNPLVVMSCSLVSRSNHINQFPKKKKKVIYKSIELNWLTQLRLPLIISDFSQIKV